MLHNQHTLQRGTVKVPSSGVFLTTAILSTVAFPLAEPPVGPWGASCSELSSRLLAKYPPSGVSTAG